MAEKEKKAETKSLYNPKDFLNSRETGKIFNANERKSVEIVKDNVGHWKKGVVYDLFVQKADFLIKQGLAKEVK